MGFATGGQTFFLWGGCMMVNVYFSPSSPMKKKLPALGLYKL
jgi:hypothetical protein